MQTDGTSTDIDNPSMTKIASLSPNIGRTRRQPIWLRNYVTSQELLDEEEGHDLTMFISVEDPVTFEEAYKNSKWREAMDMEIRAI